MKLTIKEFNKQDLIDIIHDDHDTEVFIKLESKVCGESRWGNNYTLVFQEVETGNLYAVEYVKGKTELQETKLFEFYGDKINCHLVKPKRVTTVIYEPVYDIVY